MIPADIPYVQPVEANLPETGVPYAEISDADDSRAEVADRTLPFKLIGVVTRAVEWSFGFASLLIGLAVTATVPVAQFAALGYLLEASGRVARSGRLRDGFPGVRRAARIGSIVLGTGLMLLPITLISDYWSSARLIDPTSAVTLGWWIGLWVATAAITSHVLSVWYCGGRLRQFFWPLLAPFSLGLWVARKLLGVFVGEPRRGVRAGFFRRFLADVAGAPPVRDWFVPAMLVAGVRSGYFYMRCRDAVWDFVVLLRLPYLFWLGLRGFFGTMAWLVIPLLLLVGGTALASPGGVLVGWLGGLLLLAVLLYLPFLQTHFATENRLAGLFELKRVRAMFCRAPLAFWCALFVTLAAALPLYLLMIEATPREVAFLPGIVFVASIFPARLLTGWAVGRARRREQLRHWVWRWSARLAALPVAGFYVLIVSLTRYTSWYGVWSLFEQHAFLIPVPFLTL